VLRIVDVITQSWSRADKHHLQQQNSCMKSQLDTLHRIVQRWLMMHALNSYMRACPCHSLLHRMKKRVAAAEARPKLRTPAAAGAAARTQWPTAASLGRKDIGKKQAIGLTLKECIDHQVPKERWNGLCTKDHVERRKQATLLAFARLALS